MLSYRLATSGDLAELARMRWDFRQEESANAPTAHDWPTFANACIVFLQRGLDTGQWAYWIALDDAQIVAQIFVARVPKIPKPNRLYEEIGYVTNVYTRPAYRNQGVGSQLMAHVVAWAQQQDFEELFVWPSEASVPFYQRAGFRNKGELLELDIRPYIQ